MYLSSIELIGFKSFAQRINLKFDAGITAIVGPNGCGKTNIVDAIRWVLGEQRYTTLRSDKMEDVIFNGTKHRKPVGMAEVSLVIENTKGILPTEYSEVTLTRRIFRSGESEYFINKVPCRLKDVLNLFMDTGMGADAYSVIELKMVETILSDKTDERRRLFEEAAGVTKYKYRRKAAYRKLENVQQDLYRVNDIVKEIQKTVSSLERQAKKAEQYNEISSRLRTLEIDLLEREFAYHSYRLSPLETKYNQLIAEKTQTDTALKEVENTLDELRETLIDVELQLDQQQKNVTSVQEEVRRCEEKIIVATERQKSLTENIERLQNEKENLLLQEIKLKNELEELKSRYTQYEAELLVLKEDYDRGKSELGSLAKSLEENNAKLQFLNENLLNLAHQRVEKSGEQERIASKLESLRNSYQRLQEDARLFEDDIRRCEDEINRLLIEDKELHRQLVEAESQLYKQETAKKKLKEEIDNIQTKLLELSYDIHRKNERILFIRGLIESHEGYPDGVRYLLHDAHWKSKNFITIADIIHVPERYRMAIETALGERSTYLIAERDEDAFMAIKHLQETGHGKAIFISLQRVPRYRKFSSIKKYPIGVPAINVIECKEKYRPLIDFLFEDVIIVHNPQEAELIIKEHTNVRCITLDGEFFSSSGEFRGGSRHPFENGKIGKEEELTLLEQDVARLQEMVKHLSNEQKDITQKFETFDITPFSNTVKDIGKEMTSIEMKLAQLEFEKKRASDGLERNKEEQSIIVEEINKLQQQFLLIDPELFTLQQKKIALENEISSTQQIQETIQRNYNSKASYTSELEIRVATIQNELKNIDRDILRIQSTQQEIRSTLKHRENEIQWANEEIQRLKSDLAKYSSELEQRKYDQINLETEKLHTEETLTIKRNELHRLELKIKDERRKRDEITNVIHDLEMKIAEIKSNLEHLLERGRQEFEVELTMKPYTEDDWVNFAQLREEVKTLKENLRLLGAINFAAFDEYKSESERLNFLTQQRSDLLEAEQTLLKTIDEINTTAQNKFLETFSKIRNNFILIFKELFDEGDECDLRLEESDDPLEANIEIIAKPRGKRPTSIDLLSGGEKTLTAIALLFAIYLVKPSPFCILDEVDAPLDDSNIDRFTRILRKFSDNTQFIVVTHNKRTMESANALYGVTMEEEGVSKLVTVRFNERAQVQSAVLSGN